MINIEAKGDYNLMIKTIRIGTRGSKLALVQTNLVIEEIKKYYPEIQCEIVIKNTTGDKIPDKPLVEFGGKAVFVSEFEEALIENEIDLAVHSAKDMSMEIFQGLDILGVLKREDPRDVLVTLKSKKLEEKNLSIIGTSSLRRQIQVEKLYKNIQCKSLRGNVNTRIDKLKNGEYDGIVLAAAGINRLKLQNDPECEYRYFDIEELTPAGGQGIIAIEGRKDSELAKIMYNISDFKARIELETERKTLEFFNAGCHEPVGVYSRVNGNEITIWMMREINGQVIKRKGSTAIANRLELAEAMVHDIMEGA